MGGLREYTDPNFLCFGGPVPEKYYKVNDDTYEKVTVAAGAVYVRRHEVAERGSTLAWDFFTTDNDIGFGVFYVPPGADEADRSAHRAIVALERVNAHNDRSVRPSVRLRARWPRVLTNEPERTIRGGDALQAVEHSDGGGGRRVPPRLGQLVLVGQQQVAERQVRGRAARRDRVACWTE